MNVEKISQASYFSWLVWYAHWWHTVGEKLTHIENIAFSCSLGMATPFKQDKNIGKQAGKKFWDVFSVEEFLLLYYVFTTFLCFDSLLFCQMFMCSLEVNYHPPL